MLPSYLGYISILTSSIGISFYIRDILKGNAKPNLVSWFFWMLAPLIGAFLQIKSGAGLSVLPVFMAGFVCIPVLILGLIKKQAHWKITIFDIFCGIFSLLSIIFWLLTKNTGLAIVFILLAELSAGLPTLIKAYRFPETEHIAGYMPAIFNNTIGLLIITNWIFSIYSFGVLLILENILIILFIKRKKLFKTI